MQSEADYTFSNPWFDGNIWAWDQLLKQLNPSRVLRVGSYEGKSTVYIIEAFADTNDIEMQPLH